MVDSKHVSKTELFKMRVTAEQKRKLMDSTDVIGAGTASDWWRAYTDYTAEQLMDMQAGKITPAEFGSNIAAFVQNYMSATVEHPSDDKP